MVSHQTKNHSWKITLLWFNCFNVCVCVKVATETKRGSLLPRAVVTSNCEPPTMGALQHWATSPVSPEGSHTEHYLSSRALPVSAFDTWSLSCGLMVWLQVSCLPLHSRKPNTTFDSHLSNRDFVYEKAKWSNIQTFCNSLCVFPYDPSTTRVSPAESCVFASSEAWSVSRLSLFSVAVMALAACWGLISICGNLDI